MDATELGNNHACHLEGLESLIRFNLGWTGNVRTLRGTGETFLGRMGGLIDGGRLTAETWRYIQPLALGLMMHVSGSPYSMRKNE